MTEFDGFTIPDTDALPEGLYPAKLDDVRLQQSDDGREYRQWHFTITKPDGTTAPFSANTSTALGPKSKAYGWISTLLGVKPSKGATVNPIGRRCTLQLTVDDESGYNRMAAMLPHGVRVDGDPAEAPADE